ncbi:MAG: hypothetical protein ACI8P7_000988 [Candidatus Azotimanducaceae bacterium]
MQYGICPLSIVPVRKEPDDRSEMTNQILFGEHFKVIELRKHWLKIRLAFDKYEGWICNKQWNEISEEQYNSASSTTFLCSELVSIVENGVEVLPITLGASLPLLQDEQICLGDQNMVFKGESVNGVLDRNQLIEFAYSYINSPYLWGGKSLFGIDCSGFTQMVYKLCGYQLLRDAYQQASQGESLSFVEEAQPGDLAFFDNSEGRIIHVGIILGNYDIIHASGKVRVDKIDHQGIFNKELGTHTHQLRLITRVLD